VVCKKFVSWDLSQVFFFSFVVLKGQGCPQNLVDLYWLGGLVFPSKFLNLTRLQNKTFVSLVH
jgi:hypothetical protein